MKNKEVLKRRPICRIEVLSSIQLVEYASNVIQEDYEEPKKKIMKCKIGLKKMKISVPVKVCKTVPIEVEKCVEAVKLVKENYEKKVCSFHPKKICYKNKRPKYKTDIKKVVNFHANDL